MTTLRPSALRRGFTLIELLVATALTIFLVTTASAAIYQMQVQTRRIEARQDMDAAALLVHERLYRAVSSMHPCGAVWLRSTTANPGASPPVPASIELVFLRSTESQPEAAFQVGQSPGFTDVIWTRWYWTASTVGANDGNLSIAEGRCVRQFSVADSNALWKLPGPDLMTQSVWEDGAEWGDYELSTFISVPQPRRAALDQSAASVPPADPAALLDLNNWGTGNSHDIGDYQDLIRNARPALQSCPFMTIEVQTVDGTKYTADGTANLDWTVAGAFVDGRTYTGWNARPGLVRLRCTLTDAPTQATASYSFSATPPQLFR